MPGFRLSPHATLQWASIPTRWLRHALASTNSASVRCGLAATKAQPAFVAGWLRQKLSQRPLRAGFDKLSQRSLRAGFDKLSQRSLRAGFDKLSQRPLRAGFDKLSQRPLAELVEANALASARISNALNLNPDTRHLNPDT